MEEKIKQIIEEIRPQIQMDGGDVEFVAYDQENEIVEVRLKGRCVGCPMSSFTMKQGIEARIKKEFPQIKEVLQVI